MKKWPRQCLKSYLCNNLQDKLNLIFYTKQFQLIAVFSTTNFEDKLNQLRSLEAITNNMNNKNLIQ